MTDNEFLILKTFNDNKDKPVSERGINKQINHLIGWQPYWKILSNFRANDFLIDDPLFNTSLSPVGQNAFNKENARRIQQDSDEYVSREKLHHDAFLSKWKAKSFWWLFGLAIIGGGKAVYDIAIGQIEKGNTDSQSEQTTQSGQTTHSTNSAQFQTALSGQTTHISKNDTSQKYNLDTTDKK